MRWTRTDSNWELSREGRQSVESDIYSNVDSNIPVHIRRKNIVTKPKSGTQRKLLYADLALLVQ